MTDQTKHHLHGVFKALLNGVHQRGDGGVLYVKGDECAYRFPGEFSNATFRGSLEEALTENGASHFFVVEEKDAQLHLLAYSKKRVMEEALGDAEGAASSDPTAASYRAPPSTPRIEDVDD